MRVPTTTTSALVALALSLPHLVRAGGYHGPHHARFVHWGAPDSLRVEADEIVRNECSSQGSFLAEYKGAVVCVSEMTRVSVHDSLRCPHGCCIPPAEFAECDCGEGYSWNHKEKHCTENTHTKCAHDSWWHDRSDSCIENTWADVAPTGTLPDPWTDCPSDWFWHKDHRMCRPLSKRSRGPECGDKGWDHKKQCCRGGGGGGGGEGGGGGGGGGGAPPRPSGGGGGGWSGGGGGGGGDWSGGGGGGGGGHGGGGGGKGGGGGHGGGGGGGGGHKGGGGGGGHGGGGGKGGGGGHGGGKGGGGGHGGGGGKGGGGGGHGGGGGKGGGGGGHGGGGKKAGGGGHGGGGGKGGGGGGHGGGGGEGGGGGHGGGGGKGGGGGGHGGGGGKGGGGGGHGGGGGKVGGGGGGHGGGWGKGGGGGGHGGGGHGKRDFFGRQETLFPKTELDEMYCFGENAHACTVITPGGGEWSYECIDFATELTQCGGCLHDGQGHDCTAIPNALSVGCENGTCAVYTCKNGYRLDGDECVESD